MGREIGIVFVFALAATALSFMSTAVAQDYPSLSTPPQVEQTGLNDAAVIVGIENYTYLTDIAGVTETVNDWETFFVRGLGIPSSQVYTLHNDLGTDDRIEEFAERAARDVGEGGTLWFIFIGHGAPTEYGEDGVLVGVDAEGSPWSLERRGVRRSELVEKLEQGSQAQTMVVIDTSFSGQSSTGEALVEGMRMIAPNNAARMNEGFRPKSSTVVMTAARAEQQAGPLPGGERPAFSYVLLGALRGWAAVDGEVTALAAIQYTRQHLQQLDHTQTPELIGDNGAVLVRGATEEEPQLAAAIRTALRGPEPESTSGPSEEEQKPAAEAEEVSEGVVEEPAETFTQELDELGVSAKLPAGAEVGEPVVSTSGKGVQVEGPEFFINFDVPTEFDTSDLEEAKSEAKDMYSAENMEVIELDHGFILSFTNEGSMGTNYWVIGYRNIDGNEVTCSVVSAHKAHQTTGVNLCRSLH